MIRRLFQALTRTELGRDPGPARPNQLRRDDVVLPRRRQPAPRQVAARPAPRSTATSQTRPHQAAAPPRRETPAAISLRAALSTRAGLRQAILLQEVLGPPLALRDPSSRQSRPD